MVPGAVVEIVPAAVVEMVPAFVVEMVPAKHVEATAKVNSDAQRVDFKLFMIFLLESSIEVSGWLNKKCFVSASNQFNRQISECAFPLFKERAKHLRSVSMFVN